MKLYYTPGACSLASHIALYESGANFDIESVDLRTKKTKSGQDFTSINAKGSVPALELENGEILTEGAAILQLIADQYPDAKLAPKSGTHERSRLHEILNYIAAELHKAYGPMFTPGSSDKDKEAAVENIGRKLDYINGLLSDGRKHLLGEVFSVADTYLFVMVSWAKHFKISLEKWPNVTAFSERVGSREMVQSALKAEGLIN